MLIIGREYDLSSINRYNAIISTRVKQEARGEQSQIGAYRAALEVAECCVEM